MKGYYITTERIFSPLRKWSWLFLFLVAFGGLWFPVLGLLLIPVMVALPVLGFMKGKMWCGKVCPHGSFFDRFIQWISFNRQIPAWARSKTAAVIMMCIFITIMTKRLGAAFDTWGSAAFTDKLGLVFVLNYLMVTVLGTLFAIFVNPRTWCNFCPMGTFQLLFYKLGNKLKINRSTDYKVSVLHSDMCHKCGKCSRVCPMQLSPYTDFDENYQFSNDSCIKCSTCVNNCPAGILSLKNMDQASRDAAGADLGGFEKRRAHVAEISDVSDLSDNVREITFTLQGGAAFEFEAGQFVLVKIQDEPPMFRAFSISSADLKSESFSVTVKRVNDGYGSDIIFGRFREGGRVEVEGPIGRDLVPDLNHEKIVLVAGGIGITPFVPVVKAVLEDGNVKKLTLVYGAADADSFIYAEYFEKLQERFNNFEFIPVAAESSGWSGRTGYVTDVLKDLDLNGARIYMCGPESMTENSMALFRDMNLPESAVSFEKA